MLGTRKVYRQSPTDKPIIKGFSVLKPIFDAHSIESISLTCEYDGEVDAHGLSAVKEDASRLKLKFATRRIARRPPVSVPEGHSTAPEVRGYLFLNKDGDKEKSRFEVINDNCIFTSNSYTNFNSFLAEAEFSLRIGHNAFDRSGRLLEKVILSYKDQFVSGDSSDIIGGVNPNSPYIARACLKKINFWHSNVGFFDDDLADGIIRLHNIKIHHSLISTEDDDDIAEPIAMHVLNVETYHVLGINIGEHQDFSECLKTAAYTLRKRHKEIISEILSDELIDRIGLNKMTVEG